MFNSRYLLPQGSRKLRAGSKGSSPILNPGMLSCVGAISRWTGDSRIRLKLWTWVWSQPCLSLSQCVMEGARIFFIGIAALRSMHEMKVKGREKGRLPVASGKLRRTTSRQFGRDSFCLDCVRKPSIYRSCHFIHLNPNTHEGPSLQPAGWFPTFLSTNIQHLHYRTRSPGTVDP